MIGTGSNPATCLGCGCACDDIVLTVQANRIVQAENACPMGREWFGDGAVPARVLVGQRETSRAEAVASAAELLLQVTRPLVYLCPDLTCEAQREAIALADALHAALDSVTSATAAASILAVQERGRASATLGEIRHRADVVVFWGVDPDLHYPRYRTRYAPEPFGRHVPEGRRSRTVVAVDIGDSRGPADADIRVAISPDREVETLTLLQAGRGPEALVSVLRTGRYVAIVADAEVDTRTGRDPGRAAALVALTQRLNGATRAALSTLRGGGNRSGADACLTSQTGFPMAVDFSRGYPRYRPDEDAARRLTRHQVAATVVVGASSLVPAAVLEQIRARGCVVIGPRASEGPLSGSDVVIDTGVAGIHDAGTALRMDDVPLPLAAVVTGPPAAADIVRDVTRHVRLRPTEAPEVLR